MMKHLVAVLILVLTSQPSRAETVFVNTKKHGAIEFTADAYKVFQKSKTIKKSIQILIKKKKCEAGEADLASSVAVHYSYACVIEHKPVPLILFSTNQKDVSGVNFYVDILDADLLETIQQKSEYQIKDQNKNYSSDRKNRVWYRLTIIDVQEPKIVGVKLESFDALLNEIEELVEENDTAIEHRPVKKSLNASRRR